MDEYIERESAKRAVDYAVELSNSEYDAVCNALDGLPAADVAPVVRGRWDDTGRYTFPSGETAVRCTNCGCALTESEYRLNNWNYCPVCGAKMDAGGRVRNGNQG